MNGRIFIMEKKVIVIGGGWSQNRRRRSQKYGANVTIVERRISCWAFRKRGRHHAKQRKIYCGGGKYRSGGFGALRGSPINIRVTEISIFRDTVMPACMTSSKVEPAVRRLLKEMGIDVRTTARAVDAEYENSASGKYIGSITLFDGTKLSGDVFIETTGVPPDLWVTA